MDGRGELVGEFRGEDRLLVITQSGRVKTIIPEITAHFEDDMIHIEKWHPERPITAVYYDAEKDLHFCKRFVCEVTMDKKVSFISEAEGSTLDIVSTAYQPKAKIIYNKLLKATKNLPDTEVDLASFIEVKGMKSQGNQMTKLKVKEIVLEHSIEGDEPWPEMEKPKTINNDGEEVEDDEESTTIEWDIKNDDDDNVQPRLFEDE